MQLWLYCWTNASHVYSRKKFFFEFYRKVNYIVNDFLVVQGDWNAKVGMDAQADWGEVC